MPRAPRSPAVEDRIVLSVTAGKLPDGRPLYWRIVQRKIRQARRVAYSFLVQRYVHDDGTRHLVGGIPLGDREHVNHDAALEDVATSCPGHTCSARALALVPHALNVRGTAATLPDGTRVYWCESARLWVGENLHFVTRDACSVAGFAS